MAAMGARWGTLWAIVMGLAACDGDEERGSFVTTAKNSMDYDGDGFADLLAGGDGLGGVTVLYGGPEGPRARSEQRIDVEQLSYVGDFNGDGYADAAGMYQGHLAIYPGGRSGLAAEGRILAAARDHGLSAGDPRAAGDLDGDGFDDILTLGHEAATTTGSVVFYGAASDPDRYLVLTPLVIYSAVGDVTGDGYADIANSGGDSTIMPGSGECGAIGLRRGGPSGLAELDGPRVAWGSSACSLLGAGDVDGDGRDDIVQPGGTGLIIDSCLQWQPGGSDAVTTTPNVVRCADGGGLAFVAGDTNGDGLGDILMVMGRRDPRAMVLLGSTSGPRETRSFPPDDGLPPEGDHIEWGREGHAGMVGDVNGDGFQDLAFNGQRGRAIMVHHGGPNGPSATAATVIASDDNGFGLLPGSFQALYRR